jgi:predicted nucleic acid-binding Zn ribbon protein
MRWQFSLNQILRNHWTTITTSGIFNSFQIKHLSAISKCRTAALGGHIDACNACGFYKISFNSCGNRHCPTCGALKREHWIVRQEEKLLNVPYFHVVFTIPHQLNGLCLQHPRLLYGLLFKTAWQTIQAFANDPKYLGAKTGMTSVLHTWGQNLSLHPHLHCIVPGGGITPNGKWKTTPSKGKYLFPKNALRKVFRAKFMAALKDLAAKNAIELPYELKEKLYRKKWVVYAKDLLPNPKMSLSI